MKAINLIGEAERFDPFDLNKPQPNWQLFRKEQPIFFHEATGYWVVSRYDDIKEIFNDWKAFSSENAQKPMRPMCEEGRKVLKDGGSAAYLWPHCPRTARSHPHSQDCQLFRAAALQFDRTADRGNCQPPPRCSGRGRQTRQAGGFLGGRGLSGAGFCFVQIDGYPGKGRTKD